MKTTGDEWLMQEIISEIQKRIDTAPNETARLAHVKDREIVKALFKREGRNEQAA